jgi:M6 family metalloprotease-like protein
VSGNSIALPFAYIITSIHITSRLFLFFPVFTYPVFKIMAISIFLTTILLLILSHASAMTANPNPITLEQPDGEKVTARIVGDEFDNFVTDLDGYTVIQATNGEFRYADLAGNGKLVATGVKAGGNRPPGLAKGLRPSAAVQAEECKDKICGGNGGPRKLRGQDRKLVQTTGILRNLVVPIMFSDHTGRGVPSQSDLDTLMNNEGPNTLCPTGSLRDLYLANSYDKLVVQSTVADWVTVSGTEAFYANGNSGLTTRTHDLIREALNLVDVDAQINFNDFDLNNDNTIDAITFLHSGYAAEFGGVDAYGTLSTNRMWSHKWSLYTGTWTSAPEGVQVYDYNISPAVWGTSGDTIGRIGVIAHEIGHFLGLPDLYDGTTGSGIGSYGLMANSWGFDGSQYYPPHLSAWSRIELGWDNATLIDKSGTYTLAAAELPPADMKEVIYRIDAGFRSSSEYLLIENRQQLMFDSAMPAGGLAIYHIDELASQKTPGYPGMSGGWPENNQHYRVALLQADGLWELEKGINRGGAGDLYRTTSNTAQPSSSTTGTLPNTDTYQSGTVEETGISITNIIISGDDVIFDVTLTTPGGCTSAAECSNNTPCNPKECTAGGECINGTYPCPDGTCEEPAACGTFDDDETVSTTT